MSPRFIRVVKNDRISFFNAEYYSAVCLDHISFIRSAIGGHLGCSHILAVVTNTAVNRRSYLLESLAFFSLDMDPCHFP